MIVLIGAGNNPMVGMTADFAVSIEETVILSEGFTDFSEKKTVPTIKGRYGQLYIYVIYLELASLSSLFNANSNSHGHADHRIVTCANQTHHLNVSRNGRRTSELSVRVHTAHMF